MTPARKLTFFVAAVASFSCSTPPKTPGVNVDVYLSKPASSVLPGGMKLTQDGRNDFVPYEKTINWRCLKPEDWSRILDIMRPPEPEWP